MHKTYLYQWIDFASNFDDPTNIGRLGASGKAAGFFAYILRDVKTTPDASHWIVAARREDSEWRVSALLKVRQPTPAELTAPGKHDKYLYFDGESSGFLAFPNEESIYFPTISNALNKEIGKITRGENGREFAITERTLSELRGLFKITLGQRIAELRNQSAEADASPKSPPSPDAATSPQETLRSDQSEHSLDDENSTGPDSNATAPPIDSENEPFLCSGANSAHLSVSIEDLQIQLDRRNKVGAAGELIALKFERERLGSAEIGCPDPDSYVTHTALTDVGRGYDIESTWPNHERCIEVKSSTRSGNDIYMSDNEKRVLTELGNKAWLYRVVVDAKGDGEVAHCLNNPISKIPSDHISTAVWRVRLPNSI